MLTGPAIRRPAPVRLITSSAVISRVGGAMPFIEDNLIPGERVMHRAFVHWALFIPAALLLIGALIGIVGMASSTNPAPKVIFGCLGAFCLIAAILVFIDALIRFFTT